MSGDNHAENTVEIFGATIQGFIQACINLKIVAGLKTERLFDGVEVMQWYPLQRLIDLEKAVLLNYKNTEPILERVGMAMMDNWYNYGPGKGIIKRGIEFLYYQSGSQGYNSVVKGPEHVIGRFNLLEIDEKKGAALIHSTTPFNKDLERGIIIGGMSAPGDLDYIDVNNRESNNFFEIEFH